MHKQSYEATLYAPLFYSSREGNIIETSPHLASTALMHAIGYEVFDLEKAYVLLGDEATTPAYERLANLPFVTTDMTPVVVDTSERTFRTATYTGELNVTTKDNELSKKIVATSSTKGIPDISGQSEAGWHEVRTYQGISPGSTYEFTVWSDEELPESFGFKMGIKLTGEFRARAIDERQTEPAMNKYVLENVYGFDVDGLTDVMAHSERLVRDTEPRLHRFEAVDPEYLSETLAPRLIETTAETVT